MVMSSVATPSVRTFLTVGRSLLRERMFPSQQDDLMPMRGGRS